MTTHKVILTWLLWELVGPLVVMKHTSPRQAVTHIIAVRQEFQTRPKPAHLPIPAQAGLPEINPSQNLL